MRINPVVAGIVSFISTRLLLSPLVGPAVCSDGWASQSIGHGGACSWHGGVSTNWSSVLALWASVLVGFLVWYGPNRRERERAEKAAQEKQETAIAARLAWENERAETLIEEKKLDEQLKTVAKQKGLDCPQCGHLLKLKIAKHGRHRGRHFWGCSKYPYCMGTRRFTGGEIEALAILKNENAE